MKCNMEFIGNNQDGISQYYCKTHKAFASDEKGNPLEECLCNNKEVYNNRLNLKNTNIESLVIIYENILEDVIPKIYINDKEFNGVLEYENSVLGYKDLGGIMLSKLNNIQLESVKCTHCNHYHSDNGRFAYTPHRTHLCLYCGRLFRVDSRNIGNELDLIYNIPNITLKDETIKIDDKCSIKYDLLKGILLVNNSDADKLLINSEEVSIVDFLNNTLENEY